MIRGAGILFITKDGAALFMKRAAPDALAGTWCVPGGKTEGDETAAQTAVREVFEETGREVPDSALALHCRTIAPQIAAPDIAAVPAGDGSSLPSDPSPAQAPEQVDFTTFVVRLDEPFAPTLNEEHTGYAWASLDQPPEPLHPGVRIALDRIGWDELGVARAMAAGMLTSPQVYRNVTLWNMRITGTGMAYRDKKEEFVWRDPSLYMNEDFLARCNGLPVVMEHPEKTMLNSDEWNDRVVGTVMLPYLNLEAEEVWGIVKVYDEAANTIMGEQGLSTSPGVVLGHGDGAKVTLENGKPLLIEGKPILLDHLAICRVGVWDKGGAPSGIVANDSQGGTQVADENTEETKDSGTVTPDFLLSRLDEFCSKMDARMDAMEAKIDARKDSADKDKKDSDDEDAKGDSDDDKAERVAADKKDSDDDGEKKDAATGISMADVQKMIAEATAKGAAEAAERFAKIERTIPKDLTDADHRALASTQARADSVFMAHGEHAPRAMQGETLDSYRRRLADKLKGHSKTWGKVDVGAVADSAAFDVIEEAVYADAMAAAHSPEGLSLGQLRAITKEDRTGRKITEFAGQPLSWMREFGSDPRAVTHINKDATRH